MKIKKILKVLIILIAASMLYSLMPVISLYLSKDPAPYDNEAAINKLKQEGGRYFGFIVTGDTHSGMIIDDSATLKLIKNMNREDRFKKLPIDFVAIAGDETFRGRPWEYRIYNRIRSRIKWPVISAMGNHDTDNYGEKSFNKYMGKDQFSFADRNSYFIVVNNEANELTEEQIHWIENELAGSQNYAHRFIIMHKAPLSSYFQSWFRPEVSEWSYEFMRLCDKYKVDIVFNGHEHMFKARTYGGVKYITCGGGGMLSNFPSRDGGFIHYIVVRVHGDYVDYEVRRISPPIWEFFLIYIWRDAFYVLKDAFLQ